MKCCLCLLSLLAVVVAVLYLYVSHLDEKLPSEHLQPSLDKLYRLFKKDRNVQHVMRTIGVNPMNVHLGHAVPETVVLKVEQVDNDLWYILIQQYSISETTLRFQIGVEFQETCIHNGNVIKSIITQYRNNLTHIQMRDNARYPLVIRRVFRSEELVVEIRAGHVVSTLTYFPVYEPKNTRGLT